MLNLTEPANAGIPFGKYKTDIWPICRTHTVSGSALRVFPEGKVAQMLAAMHELKTNGMKKLLIPRRKS